MRKIKGFAQTSSDDNNGKKEVPNKNNAILVLDEYFKSRHPEPTDNTKETKSTTLEIIDSLSDIYPLAIVTVTDYLFEHGYRLIGDDDDRLRWMIYVDNHPFDSED
jgi:hypothetical protein